jgi:cytochrome c oxidase subunit III
MTETMEVKSTNHAVPPGAHRDYEGTKMGMWIFLFTEIILFGGMFLLYSAYRAMHPTDFHRASLDLDVRMGTFNTALLLTSSLTAALSIGAIKKGDKKFSTLMIVCTILIGLMFLMNKYFEWSHEISHGLYPRSPVLLKHTRGEILFFGLYYTMTGLHGVHVFVGIVVFSVVLYYIKSGLVTQSYYSKLENSGLYWHLVDIIWIFLFPLFYLVT